MTNVIRVQGSQSEFVYEKINEYYDDPLKLIKIECRKNESPLSLKKHYHRSLEIVVPITTDLVLFDNGITKTIKKGNIYIINSCNVHTFEPVNNYQGYALQIDYNYLINIYPEFDEYVFTNDMYDNELLFIVHQLINYKESDEDSTIITSYCDILMKILVSRYSTSKINKHGIEDLKNNNILVDVLQHLENNYNEEINIMALAKKFNISYGYLAKIFKFSLGVSINQYLTDLRVNKAKMDLQSTNYSIKDIALKNGFVSSIALSDSFKKIYGITPSVYRKQLRKSL